MKIFDLQHIQNCINITRDFDEFLISQKHAFIDFSSGIYEVPSPMQFIFPHFGSDCHIKAGYKKFSQNLIVKIANSTKLAINGMILVSDVSTGEIKAILHDKGFLTTLRTAIAGILTTELIPWKVKNIGIIGSGNLAQQLYNLISIKYDKSNIMLYARDKFKAKKITKFTTNSIDDLLEKCDIIFTTTSSTEPIIHDIPKCINKAIIGLGSDDEHKSEISPNVFKKADIVIVDSKFQSSKFGDVAKALKSEIIDKTSIFELGELLKSPIRKRINIILADFSGIGAQDVAIAEFILQNLQKTC